MVSVRRGFASFSVDDVGAARQFYSDVLGLRVTDAADSLILHLPGGTTVFVYPKEDHTAATFTVFHLAVDDVDAVVDELAAQGVEPLRYDAFDHDDKGVVRGFMEGGDGAWFADPAGNVIGFMDGEGARLFEEATSA
ncbi:putative enzyme related to lactoylglutathione lyase [Isoptericola jiangsuensis]|uniref:Putative enzyme related to lactoylglutathione lyase n=1 Tax=Isoptericola jiangsuensis TaxID=548579 RepID=A0A2A9F2I3_9MICO|nr:VOC family protein [Isoptericola jiangsuensis]PFG44665.1 putative enzyme related to lactoylglutathione lyase [Isoptericola jiangsuensis]